MTNSVIQVNGFRAGDQGVSVHIRETRVAGREPLDGPAWRWPKR